MYYRGAPAAIVVYDITSRSSFDKAKEWVRELKEEQRETTIALAGNKCDLVTQQQVPTDEARQYASDEGLIFQETSAKRDTNIKELFEQLAHVLPKKATAVADHNITKFDPDGDAGGCGC